MDWKLGGENPMSGQYCFKANLLKRQRTRRKSSSLRRSLDGLLSLCLLFIIRCLKNRCKPSKSVSPTTTLEVLIRAAVTRLIVASRGQCSHS